MRTKGRHRDCPLLRDRRPVTGGVRNGATRPPANVVIVTLDTTRADRLAAYGGSGVSTPALDRLAREGVVFDRAESVAPLTLPAHASLFTGLYPARHGVRENADRALDAAHRTLPEVLKARGFHTAAFVGSTVLARGRGLDRGFDVYRDGGATGTAPPRRRPGNMVVDEAWRGSISELRALLLWVHLYDAHAPQTPPIEYRRASGGDPYTAAIAFADAQVGRLLEALERQRTLDHTAVILAADHGESLGDHGELEHGIFVYESVLHVPLIARIPGFEPRRVEDLASLVDVVPTVLDLLAIAPIAADGLSLVPVLRGRAHLPERALYSESLYARRFGWSPLRVLRDARYKLIDAPRPELYDLHRDPFEEHDLSAERAALVTAMRRELRRIEQSEEARGPRGAAGRIVRGPQRTRRVGIRVRCVTGARLARPRSEGLHRDLQRRVTPADGALSVCSLSSGGRHAHTDIACDESGGARDCVSSRADHTDPGPGRSATTTTHHPHGRIAQHQRFPLPSHQAKRPS
jgi:arylsulfatase A-like enzyme